MAEQKPEATRNGTQPAYRVEAMYDAPGFLEIAGQTFTRDWERVHFVAGSFGVPIGARHEAPILAMADCTSYEAAQALRWWFHATADASGIGGICLSSRIVRYEIKYSIEVVRTSEHQEIGGDDRSNSIPDWGGKKAAAA